MGAQRRAKITELFDELGDLVSKDSASYFASRSWERGDATCNLPGSPDVEVPDCSHSASTAQRGNRRAARPISSSSGRHRRHRRARRQGRQDDTLDNVVTVRVDVPDGHMPDSYLDVEMPEGDMHAVLVNQTAVENGYFDIRYRPVASNLWRNRLRRRLQAH